MSRSIISNDMERVPKGDRVFGRYELLFQLAAGGMAQVYVGRQRGIAGFSKLVAIKRIHQDLLGDDSLQQMFVDEARIASRIAHPNVVQTLDLGQLGGRYFIAMEYVHGQSLAALLARRRLPMRMAMRIASEAAAGLHAAHQTRNEQGDLLGVVHRDVSPHNILIGYDGSVRVTDFGVALAKDNISTTAAGSIKGKYGYLSPEQAAMQSTVDCRSDIFTLGIVLYEATTHQRLYDVQNAAAALTMVASQPIPRPSQQREDYPPDLERIVLKALAHDPEERHQTAQQLQIELEHVIAAEGKPVLRSAIGELMRESFEDRLGEWQQSLSGARDNACRVGNQGGPQGEREQQITTATGLPTVASDVGVAAHNRRTRLWAVLLVALVGLVAAVGLAVYRAQSSPASPGVAPSPLTVQLAVAAAPAQAQIRVDGRLVSNPYRAAVAQQARFAQVEISAPGYVTRVFEVSLAESGNLLVDLRPEPTEVAASRPASRNVEVEPGRQVTGGAAKISVNERRSKKRKVRRRGRTGRAAKRRPGRPTLFDSPFD